MHHPLDVFHHHNGIVDQQTNGQYQSKHGQGIDGIATQGQHAKRAHQHHRHSHSRYQCGAPILQKHIHHHHHQHDGLKQGNQHLFYRCFHKRRTVLAGGGAIAFREIGFELLDFGIDRVGHIQGIGTIGQNNAQSRAIFAIELGLHIGAFRPQFNPRHVFQLHDAAIGRAFDDDVFKLRHRAQLAAGLYRHTQHLRINCGQLAQLACGNLGILIVDGGADV